MESQPEAVVVETPRRRFRIRLPKRSTLKTIALAGGAFGLGAVVTARKMKSDCACENDTTEQSTTDS